MDNKPSYPLTFAKEKTKLKVERISNKQDVVTHLLSLGLTIGSEFELFSLNKKGIIIKLKGAKIAIDESVGKNIFVSEVQQTDEFTQ